MQRKDLDPILDVKKFPIFKGPIINVIFNNYGFLVLVKRYIWVRQG